MYQILQTNGREETVVGTFPDIESATCFAEHRHMVTNAARTRVTDGRRTAKDRDGREWEWVKK
jgi:hypothetical protein